MRLRITILAMFCFYAANAQMYDAQWAIAPNLSFIDFRSSNVQLSSPGPRYLSMILTDANICDSAGNILFITDGLSIYGSNGYMLPNGDSLSPCPYNASVAGSGLNIQQAALFLPDPGNGNQYYLFHQSDDTLNQGRPGTLYYSLLKDSTGSGVVLRKNVVYCKGIFRDGGMTACKHANGRDYWIVQGQHWSNNYYKFLLTPDTILGPFIQSIGPPYVPPFDNAYSKFSQDGSKYATGCIEGYVTVMDFDRCTGEFSNAIEIFNDAGIGFGDSISGSVSLEFSPSGRFLYVSDRINLNQYDLQAANIQDSVELYFADSIDFPQMDMLQLSPNGKIYGSTWSGGAYFFHVINAPDSLGDSCHFVYGGQSTLTSNSNKVPNLINYKLGPLVGSVCDTLHLSTAFLSYEESRMRILPNPADKYVYVEMGMQGSYVMQLLNAVGQVVAMKETRQVDIFDTEKLASGVYFIKTVDKTTQQIITTKKVMVAH